MATFNFSDLLSGGGNLGNIFSGGMSGTPTGLDALLSEDQRKLLGRNATLSAAAALLQAGAPSATPIGLGQALGSALQAGQQGYQQARLGSLQDLLLGEKLKEAQRLGQYQTELRGSPTATPATSIEPLNAAQASLISQTAPIDTAGPFGPTVNRASIMNAALVTPPAPVTLSKTDLRYEELIRKADIANQYNRPDDAEKFINQALKIKPPEEFSTTPQFGTSPLGTPISFVLNKSGGMKLLDFNRSPEFNYQDTGSYISVRDKNTNKEIERISKTMTPGEVSSNRIAQAGLGLRQKEFDRGAFDRVETPEGFFNIPKGGGIAVPVMGPGDKQLKGVSGGKATEGERKAATLLSRMQLAQTQMDQGKKGMPGFFTSMSPRVGLDEERKRTEDAQLDFLDAALTLATGAAYTEFQLKGAMQSYFPRFGDDATTIAEKETRRQNLMEAARISAGSMGGAVPPPPPSTSLSAPKRKNLNDIFGVQ